jgi:predicted Zn-dependent protease with MMP-like domain
MRIRIFSSAIVDACDTIEEVRHEVWMTVIHELAHHFGWSERDLENFEGGLELPNGIFQPRHPDAD